MTVKVETKDFKYNHHHAPFASSILADSKFRTQIATGKDTVFKPFVKLAAEPMEIDLVIDVPIGAVVNLSNPIAEIFREHNVFEYKPYNHDTTIQDFYKTLGYHPGLLQDAGLRVLPDGQRGRGRRPPARLDDLLSGRRQVPT